jgi:hypothetical protein
VASKYRWTPEKYRAALVGRREDGVEGLRSLVRGFESKKTAVRDAKGRFSGTVGGYDLKRIDEWTPQQRRKVRDYFHRVEQLEGQAKLIIRPRGEGAKAKLEKLHESFHGDIPSQDFKVAFIPYHDPKTSLPGAKRVKPKVRLTRQGVSIKTRRYERIFIPFDQKRIVRDPVNEIKRAASQIPGAQIYFAQVGDNQTVNGMSIGILTRQILQWMEQYDGKSKLPEDSGNKGDSPRHHHWKQWLRGLVGYILPGGKQDFRKVMRLIDEGRKENNERKRKLRNFMKREGVEAQPEKGKRYIRPRSFKL